MGSYTFWGAAHVYGMTENIGGFETVAFLKQGIPWNRSPAHD